MSDEQATSTNNDGCNGTHRADDDDDELKMEIVDIRLVGFSPNIDTGEKCGICQNPLCNFCNYCESRIATASESEFPAALFRCLLSHNKNCRHVYHTHCLLESFRVHEKKCFLCQQPWAEVRKNNE